MIKVNNEEIPLLGSFFSPGDLAQNFVLVDQKMNNITLNNFENKPKVILTIPGFYLPSYDLPIEDIDKLVMLNPSLSIMVITKGSPLSICPLNLSSSNLTILFDCKYDSQFGKHYGVLMTKGMYNGLFAPSFLFIDKSDKIITSSIVPDIDTKLDLSTISS